jgi:glucuronoarabinoxylan endo-1,4-beta-xylanase
MKTNGATSCRAGAGHGALAPASYASYATYLTNYVKSLRTYHSIDLFGISVQNEPQVCQQYESALWTGANIHDFVKNNLGPTLAASGLGTRIMLPESGGFSSDATYAGACMADPACAKYVDINAFHGYDDSFAISNAYPATRFWQTENGAGVGYGPNAPGCSNGQWCPGIADAMMWANIIDYGLGTANLNAWHYWQLVGLYNDNEGLLNRPAGNVTAIRAYVIGNWSKYVRPGWVRVDATHNPAAGVTVTAFKDPASGKFAIVAVNRGSSPVDLTFDLAGFPAVTSLIPTVTSANDRLADKPAVTVSANAFCESLPATSVVTFHSP